MPLKLISPGGGSVILNPASTGSSVTLTVPAVNANVITDTANSVTQTMMSSGLAGTGPAFHVYRNTNQTVTSSTNTKIQFNVKQFDTASCFDATTNYRFTPNVAGYYFITLSIWFESWSSGPWIADILFNGGSLFTNAEYTSASYFGPQNKHLSGLIYMNGSTDYVEASCYTGGSTTAVIYGAQNRTYMCGYLARAA